MAVTTSISPVQFDVNSSLSTAQRQTQGQAARDRIHPAQLGDWNPQSRGHDALETILAQSAIRQSDLLPIRHGRMSASAWTYYRGAAAVAAADLGSRPNSGLTVQICGDAHILNFGLWATPERNLSFDLRDFDETLPGPFEWDVSRLVASIVVLARDSGLKQTVADRAVAACLAAYRARMAKYSTAKQLDIWYDKVTVDDLIGVFTTKDQKRASSLEEDRRHLLDGFTPQDAVQQIVGIGSVGMRVYLLLLNGCHDNDPLFLQIKQAGPSVYEPFAGASVHTNHGQRVVAGQRLIQSATGIFVGWISAQGFDFYVRQFRDMKVIADAEFLAPRP
ncbi:DUF2252 family protein [Arthrobacter sp. E3]|uniref:DUF2252 domain-containing protein n=1 Tax=Arthrobacter sp. E3 TaxID=517402 RepID=UPI001A945824|nr:DUF2252 family protein [Arthrobacter sp. E3]